MAVLDALHAGAPRTFRLDAVAWEYLARAALPKKLVRALQAQGVIRDRVGMHRAVRADTNLPEQTHETRLFEVVVGRQRLNDAAVGHDHEARTIDEASLLVGTLTQEGPGFLVESGIDVEDIDPVGGSNRLDGRH